MFDFIGKAKIFISISVIAILLGLGANLIFGTELSINFKGGTMITYSYDGDLSLEEVETSVQKIVDDEVTVTRGSTLNSTSSSAKSSLNISIATDINDDQLNAITGALAKDFKDQNIEMLNFNTVPATTGAELFAKGLFSIAIASILMLVYISFRFKKIGGWSAGTMALLALIHDVILAYMAFVVFRLPLDDNFIAVVLTILGYSLNDTIVIYDRIRENRMIYGDKKSLAEICNISLNQTFTRSLNVSVATFIAVAAISVVAFIANIESILSFSLPMSIGVIAGSYSSICVAVPLWVMWKNKLDKSNKTKSKAKKA